MIIRKIRIVVSRRLAVRWSVGSFALRCRSLVWSILRYAIQVIVVYLYLRGKASGLSSIALLGMERINRRCRRLSSRLEIIAVLILMALPPFMTWSMNWSIIVIWQAFSFLLVGPLLVRISFVFIWFRISGRKGVCTGRWFPLLIGIASFIGLTIFFCDVHLSAILVAPYRCAMFQWTKWKNLNRN